MSHPLKVAVAGASGIGKHHAKWYAMTGCEVVAFLGTGPETCARTSETLQRLFGFKGNAYQDMDTMLNREQPDIVDVCTPHPFHYEHAMKALEFGAHVMCEKPLIWQPGKPTAELLALGQEMVDTAKAKGLKLAVTNQYVAAVRNYLKVYEKVQGPLAKADTFFMEMESKGGTKEFEDVWLDLASHPLSIVIDLMPDGEIAYDTLQCEIAQKRNIARFHVASPTRGSIAVEILLGDILEGTPTRRFGVNGYLVDALGKADEHGVYRSVLKYAEGETVYEDTMHTTIAAFVEAVCSSADTILVRGEIGLRNLEWQLQILDQAKRT